MKKVHTIAVFGGLIATTGIASAQVLDFGNLTFAVHPNNLPADEVYNFDFTLTGADVLGFVINFDYVNNANDSSWGSDLELQITTPSLNTYIIGQSSFNGGDPFGPQTDIWDFDGVGSQPSGHYTSDNFFAIKEPQEGIWNFMFTETWDGDTAYNNLTIEMIKVPAPGALALLGVAGLAGCRRRRRS